uniref:Leucine rich repeat containing 75A n=1 Tax=Cyanoderma ruficeps TaxID=181631 RepID=A0A8C3NSH0_9PASS
MAPHRALLRFPLITTQFAVINGLISKNVVGYGSTWLGGCWHSWKHNLELPKPGSCSFWQQKGRRSCFTCHEGKLQLRVMFSGVILDFILLQGCHKLRGIMRLILQPQSLFAELVKARSAASLKDLGMESTSLDDVLYRYASFRNLVDPITHDLIISLARYIHCPKPEGDSLGAMEKLCRQLTYHLSPHSQWRRQGIMKRKPQSCLKAVLMGKPQDNTVDLSGIPLSPKDVERVTSYLEHSSEHIDTVELCFTELTDELLLQLLPALGRLPRLTTLALNGNRLTKAVLRDLTDTLKDPNKFPSVTWIDLGNNVDIFSLPQPFLVSLKRRCPKQGNLPTILEFGEGQVSDLEGLGDSQEELRAGPGRDGSTDSGQTDTRAEAGELPGSEQGAATPQT